MKRLLVIIASIICLFVLASGCSLQPPATVTVTNLGWYIYNIPASYWLTSPPPATCFYSFWIYYTGNCKLEDVEYARVYLPGNNTWWTLALNSNTFSAKSIGGSGKYYDQGNSLPIGDLKAEIKLKNGAISSFVKTIPAPGSKSPDGYDYVYTKEYGSTSDPLYTPMLIRPTISGTSTKYTSTKKLTIDFTITDTRTYNGWVWLFDSSNNYIGYLTTTFRDETTGAMLKILNNGGNFNFATTNTITLQESDINFTSGYTFGDISRFHLVVTDGNQYAAEGRYYAYDCEAISDKTSFSIQP